MGQDGMNQLQHRGTIRSYFDLTAWQKARLLVKAVYETSSSFPQQEIYGLVSQIRRAAVSVPSNIAEGYGRGTRNDYIHFLHTSRGSLYEIETQMILAQDLGFVSPQQAQPAMKLITECGQLLNALIGSLERD